LLHKHCEAFPPLCKVLAAKNSLLAAREGVDIMLTNDDQRQAAIATSVLDEEELDAAGSDAAGQGFRGDGEGGDMAPSLPAGGQRIGIGVPDIVTCCIKPSLEDYLLRS
jgi:hypothetical protein